MPVSPLPRFVLAPESPLHRVRELLLELVPEEGHVSIQDPLSICLYRFRSPTKLTKAATFGVTLGVVLEGSKCVRISDHEIAVDPNRMIVITRETEHDAIIACASPDRPYLAFAMCFSPESVARALLALSQAGETKDARETVPAFVLPCDDAIANALERLLRSLRDPIDRKLLVPLAAEEILFRLLRSDAAAAVRAGIAHPQDAGRIVDSMRFIREHHHEKLTVHRLAKSARMSTSHYAHRFSAVARVSPMRYLREVRLETARGLLATSGARAGDVASRVGFESAAHFAREFKRRFGVSPSRYARA